VRKRYPSDLTDAQWQVLQTLIPPAKPGGRPRQLDRREVLNTLFYKARTGCQWDYLPHDLLPKSTVRDYFDAWQDDRGRRRRGSCRLQLLLPQTMGQPLLPLRCPAEDPSAVFACLSV
jgi:transposase